MVESTAANKVLVVDMGTDTVKFGYAGETEPKEFIPTGGCMTAGRVMDWDKMEAVWT